MKKLLLGLTGVTGSNGTAGCGKDAVALMLSKLTGLPVYGFADPIYDMVKAGLGIDGKALDANSRELKNAPIDWLTEAGKPEVSVRYLLETLGTEWGRDLVHSEIWLRIAMKRYSDSERGLIIKDVRFPNEAKMVRELGHLIYIFRPTYFFQDATETHSSNLPLELQKEDLVVKNDSDLAELEVKIREICVQQNWV